MLDVVRNRSVRPSRKCVRLWLPVALCAAAFVFALVFTVLTALNNARREQAVSSQPQTRVASRLLTSDLYRPAYHITPPAGWLNDPNGLLFHKGVFHAFFQFNPLEPIWGAPYWGHVASTDLVRWKRLPPALVPDAPYDYDGVFSGSATVLPLNGSHGAHGGLEGPLLMYTGVSRHRELGAYFQVQAIARPADPEDRLLVRWLKPPVNPVLTQPPPGGTNFQFRDPQTAWRARLHDKDVWLTTKGAQVRCLGSAPLYASQDFVHWHFAGYLARQGDAQPAAEGARCEQKGGVGVGRTWEVVACFEVPAAAGSTGGPPVRVLKWSDQVKGRVPEGRDWYLLSDVELDYSNVTADAEGPAGRMEELRDAFVATVRGAPVAPRLLDHGDVYASNFVQVESDRLLWMGWTYETAGGCSGTCAAGSAFTRAQGWQGAQTLLREVSVDRASQTLMLNPIAEVALLRSGELAAVQRRRLWPGRVVRLPLGSGRNRQVDAVVEFEVGGGGRGGAAEGGEFEVGLRLVTGRGVGTSVVFNGTVTAGGAAGLGVQELGMWVDRSQTGGLTSRLLQGGNVTLPVGRVTKVLSLRMLVDHSVLEVFGQGGRLVCTSRIYPDQAARSWSLHVFNNRQAANVHFVASAKVWRLAGAFVDDI